MPGPDPAEAVSDVIARKAREVGVEVGREGQLLGEQRRAAPWETTAMAVWEECLPESFPRPLSAPSRLVAVAGGWVVGAVAYDHANGVIRAFGVSRRFRRRGIGRLLIVAAIAHIATAAVDAGKRVPVPTAFCLHPDLAWDGAGAEPLLAACGFQRAPASAQPAPDAGVEFELVVPDFAQPGFAHRVLFQSSASDEGVLAAGMLPVARNRHVHPHTVPHLT